MTVGELRKELEGVPDDTPVLIDFETEYDGQEVEKQGVAVYAMMCNAERPNFRIDATEEYRS